MAYDIAGASEGVIGKVLTLVVVLAILGGTIALVFTNLGTVIAEFTGASTGSDTLDSIIVVLGLVVGITVVFGLVGVIAKAVKGSE